MPEDQERLTTDDLATSSQQHDPDSDTAAREVDGDAGREAADRTDAGREAADRTDAGREAADRTDARREAADRTDARDAGPSDGRPAGDGDREADRAGERDEPLLPPSDLEELRRRWDSVQTQFVDEPRRAVEDADALVAEVMRNLADTFASERSNLEEQWERAGEADTETLRVTLQRYRSFFNRLLST